MLNNVANYSFRASHCVLTVHKAFRCNSMVVNSAVLQFVFGALEIARKKMEAMKHHGSQDDITLGKGRSGANLWEIAITIDQPNDNPDFLEISILNFDTSSSMQVNMAKSFEVDTNAYLVSNYLMEIGLGTIGGSYECGRVSGLAVNTLWNLQRLRIPVHEYCTQPFPILHSDDLAAGRTQAMIRVGMCLDLVEKRHAFVDSGKLRVLLIDPDEAIAAMSAHTLHLEGWECNVVTSYAQLEQDLLSKDEKVYTSHLSYDIVVVDVRLRDKIYADIGVDLAFLLPAMCVVGMVPYKGFSVRRRSYFRGFVSRPFNDNTIQHLVTVAKTAVSEEIF